MAVDRRTLLHPVPHLIYVGGLIAGFVTVLLVRAGPLHAHVQINIWWFESLHIGSVYGTQWAAQKSLFLVYGSLTLAVLSVALLGARALTFAHSTEMGVMSSDKAILAVGGFAVALASVVAGHDMAAGWQTYLLAGHSVSFGITDPIHHADLSFYVFTIPWRDQMYAYAGIVIVVAEIAALVAGGYYSWLAYSAGAEHPWRRFLTIVSIVLAAAFVWFGLHNLFVNPFDLTQAGTVYGADATWVHSVLWWMPIVAAVELLAAGVLLFNGVLRSPRLLAVVGLPIIVVIAAAIGRTVFQSYVVAPNQLSAEYRYLTYNLQFTRHAFGLDGWKRIEYTPQPLSAADVRRGAATLGDARIADLGAFASVMRQTQENRTYYAFNTPDIDRYTVGSRVRQVLLAARELDTSKLPSQAQNWVNVHLKFTHGYGLAMAPANAVSSSGLPIFWIGNIPVQETQPGLPRITQPRIYFGEDTNDYALVDAGTPEFDSATADQDLTYRYAGPDGIPVRRGRLTIAWAVEGGLPWFDRLNLSSYVTARTRILIHRNILDRVRTIAPWLQLDNDPYLVVRRNGTLVWMIDGMTHSDRYPFSEPVSGENYMRNSVKITVDAYTGVVHFYAFDPTDPILRSWMHIFPGLVQPLRRMPADLREHIKYPDAYFNWQARAFEKYHVTDVTSLYNADNQWDIESETTYDWGAGAVETGTMKPIWTKARLFGSHRDGFYSVLAFSVRGKATLAGYLAADNNSYAVTDLEMPRGSQTMGSAQFESLYNQAPTISSQLTLLDQHGSQVLPGQTVILPLGKALVYIKSLYLKSAGGQSLPQLIKVIAGSQNAVNWGNSLAEAIDNLVTRGDISNLAAPSPSTPPSPTPTASPAPPGRFAHMSTAALLRLALQLYRAEQQTSSLTLKDRYLRELGQILTILTGRTQRPGATVS